MPTNEKHNIITIPTTTKIRGAHFSPLPWLQLKNQQEIFERNPRTRHPKTQRFYPRGGGHAETTSYLLRNKNTPRMNEPHQATPLWKRKAFALLPIGILGLALVTIVAAYHATFSDPKQLLFFEMGRVKTPPISLLMFAGRGRRIGQIGFPLVAALFGWISPTVFRVMEQEMNKSATTTSSTGPSHNFQGTIQILKLSSTIAFVCLAIVGAIPLQANVVQVMRQEAPITISSFIHQLAAAFFFALCIVHMGTWLYFCRYRASSDLIFYYQNSKISFRLKLACLVLCFIPLPTAFLLHPISPVRKRLALSEADAGGITQYALVACVASFFASYSMELWHHAVSSIEEEEEVKEETSKNKKNT